MAKTWQVMVAAIVFAGCAGSDIASMKQAYFDLQARNSFLEAETARSFGGGVYEELVFRFVCMNLLHIFLVDVYAERWHLGLQGIPARRWAAALEAGFCYSAVSAGVMRL